MSYYNGYGYNENEQASDEQAARKAGEWTRRAGRNECCNPYNPDVQRNLYYAWLGGHQSAAGKSQVSDGFSHI